MLEVGLGESKDSFVEFAREDNCAGSNKDVDLAYNLGGDEGDGIFMPILGEEAIEVDHLLVEPYVVRTLESNLSSKNVEKPLTMGDLPFCAEYYSQRDHYGILDADADQVGRQALKHELIDGMLQGAEVDENLHVTCNILCDCSDYLLNNSLLDYPSNNDSAVTNIGLECQIQFMEKEGGDDKSALQYTAQSLAIGTSGNAALPLDSINFHERHDTLHGTFGWDASVGEHKLLKSHMLFDPRSKTVLDNVSNLMESGLLSNENDDNMILTSDNEYGSLVDVSHSRALHSKVGALMDEHSTDGCQAAMMNLNLENFKDSGETNNAVMTTKRLRKPTRRYIEETSEIKKKCSYERFKMPLASFKNNYHHEKTECQHHCRSAMQLLHEDCPDKVHSLRDHQTKHVKRLVSDNKRRILPSDSRKITFCPTLYDSEQQGERQDENCTAIMRQRKHHRQWTLSEVIKLVDGVSQYGVGRWTEIKRLLFSATAYRTAVDLKDKWRNLLRASVIISRNKNLVDPQKKHASSPIPESIMWRVRELSIIHPYPRDRKLRIKTAPTTPVTFSGTSNASIINLRSRIRPNQSFA